MTRRRAVIAAALAAALLAGTAAAGAAGGLSLDWFSVDGGGGASSGGSFHLSGTIGQPDAGTLSGSGYTLHGGFWSAALPGYQLDLPLVVR